MNLSSKPPLPPARSSTRIFSVYRSHCQRAARADTTSVNTRCRSSTPATGWPSRATIHRLRARPRASPDFFSSTDNGLSCFFRQIIETHHAAMDRHRFAPRRDVVRRMRPSRSRRLATNFAVLMPMAKQISLRRQKWSRCLRRHASCGIDQRPAELPGLRRRRFG